MGNPDNVSAFLKESSFFYTIAINMSGTYSYISPNYDQNFKKDFDTLLGKPFFSTLHTDDIKICEAVGAQCFANPGELFPATLRKHDGKGGYVITQWELKAIIDKRGEPEGIFCIGYNITEYVDTRNELVHAQSEIDQKNEQLYDIGFIQSHVVRKPLANIIGLISVLNTMNMNTNTKSITELLLASAKELDEVIILVTEKTTDIS